MKIETKFSIGDSVWVMKENKPYEFFVTQIAIHSWTIPMGGCNTAVHYIDSRHDKYSESACYASKEELLASL